MTHKAHHYCYDSRLSDGAKNILDDPDGVRIRQEPGNAPMSLPCDAFAAAKVKDGENPGFW